jgi:hypothetical protein
MDTKARHLKFTTYRVIFSLYFIRYNFFYTFTFYILALLLFGNFYSKAYEIV